MTDLTKDIKEYLLKLRFYGSSIETMIYHYENYCNKELSLEEQFIFHQAVNDLIEENFITYQKTTTGIYYTIMTEQNSLKLENETSQDMENGKYIRQGAVPQKERDIIEKNLEKTTEELELLVPNVDKKIISSLRSYFNSKKAKEEELHKQYIGEYYDVQFRIRTEDFEKMLAIFNSNEFLSELKVLKST